MPDLSEQPPATPRVKRGFFTAENAAKYAALAHAANRDRIATDKAVANADELAVIPADSAESFTMRRLMRVRCQLEKLDRLAATAHSSKRLKELADATTRLSEQERILAGRPLPGSRRPREDRGRASAGWIELQPAMPPSASTAQVAPTTAPPPAVLEPDKLPGDVTP